MQRIIKFFILILFFLFLIIKPTIIFAQTNTTSKTGISNQPYQQNANNQDEEENGDEEDEEDEDGGFSIDWGGEEEIRTTQDIQITGEGIREITFAGVKFTGQFIQQSPGVYLAQGEISLPDFGFSLGTAAGQLVIDKNQNKITGQLYIKVPVYGKIAQVTDLVISTSQLKFKGVFDETITLGSLSIQFVSGLVDFEISKTRFACKAEGGFSINISGIPGTDGPIEIDIVSGDVGFTTAIPPEAIAINGSGTIEIPLPPPVPPLKLDLSGNLKLSKNGFSGEGSVEVYEVEVGNGAFSLGLDGKISLQLNAGIFKEEIIEINVAGASATLDIPAKLFKAGLKQEVKILNAITIPGAVKGNLTIDFVSKKLTVEGKAGFSLFGVGAPEALSLGIKNFIFDIVPFDSTNPTINLNGDAYISKFTLGGFRGSISNAVLNGTVDLYLPPGLKQLLDLEKVSLPLTVDLRSVQTLTELGGEVSGLAIKHFPLEGPKILIKSDGIHLIGQIGIANVITIPLGDLKFTKNENYTKLQGDVGIGPFTLAKADFILPAKDDEPIKVSGKMGIPGLNTSISAKIFTDGKIELANLNKLGFLNFESMARASVSKQSLLVDNAKFNGSLGSIVGYGLEMKNVEITPQKISGTGIISFSSLIGINKSLEGNLYFDGNLLRLTFPNPVNLCGLDVRDVIFEISTSGFSGSGKIVSPGGQTISVSISIENDLLVLKDPIGKIIATGFNIAKEFAQTVADIAEKEAEVISEDASKVLDNLERMAEPWIQDFVKAYKEAKEFYNKLEEFIKEKIIEKLSSLLNQLKDKINAAIAAVKQAIDKMIDAFCDAVNQLIEDAKKLVAEIESLIPSPLKSTYDSIKQKVINAANALKQRIETFRQTAKQALYVLTNEISKLYQEPIDYITSQANKIASEIRRQLNPLIQELDKLLTEIGQEIDKATTKVGREAQEYYNRAKEKARIAKGIAENILNNFKKKLDILVSPYLDEIRRIISPYLEKVEQVKNMILDELVSKFNELMKEIEPYLEPFKNALKELKDLAAQIGGAVLDKVNQGLQKIGETFNAIIKRGGDILVRFTDKLGDIFVSVTSTLADISEKIHQGLITLAEAIRLGYITGKEAVKKGLTTAEEAIKKGYATLEELYNEGIVKAQEIGELIKKGIVDAKRPLEKGWVTAEYLIDKGIYTAEEMVRKGLATAEYLKEKGKITAEKIADLIRDGYLDLKVALDKSLISLNEAINTYRLIDYYRAVKTGLTNVENAVRNGVATVEDSVNLGLTTVSEAINKGLITGVDAVKRGLISAADAIAQGFATTQQLASAGINYVVTTVECAFDDNAPNIYNVTITPYYESCVITWDTNEEATSRIEAGAVFESAGYTKNHRVVMTNLLGASKYDFTIKSKDKCGNTATKSGYSFTTLDNVAPVISGVSFSVEGRKATITWNTNEPTTSQVEFGTSTNYGQFSQISTTLVTNHRVVLEELTPNTIYHFRVKSKDANNNLAVSQNYFFNSGSGLPANFTFSAGQATSRSLTFTWTKINDPKFLNYVLYLSPTMSPFAYNWTFSSDNPNTTTATISNLNPGTTYYALLRINLNDGTFIESPKVSLSTLSVIEGYVLDKRSGEVIPSALVKLFKNNQVIAQVSTTDKGYFIISNLASVSGDYKIEVSKTDYITQLIPVQLNSMVTVNLQNNRSVLNILVKINGVPTAQIPLKVEDITLGTVWNRITDAEGKTQVVVSFSNPVDIQVGAKDLKIIIPASREFKIRHKETIISLSVGEEKTIEIECDQDTQVPQITDINIFQKPEEAGIYVRFVVQNEGVKSSLLYYTPKGEIKELPWTEGYAVGGLGFNIGNLNSETDSGNYRIKIRIMDGLGNVGETDFFDFIYFTSKSLEVNVIAGTDSALISWQPYPRDEDFGKYEVFCSDIKGTAYRQRIEITDRLNTSYNFSNLQPGENYVCCVVVYNNFNQRITKPNLATKNFRTKLPPAKIESFSVSPQLVTRDGKVELSAQISNPGNYARNIKLYLADEEEKPFYTKKITDASFNLSYSLDVAKIKKRLPYYKVILEVKNADGSEGSEIQVVDFKISEYERPKVEKKEIPSEIFLNVPSEFIFLISNPDRTGTKNFQYLIDWGDGTEIKEGTIETKTIPSFIVSKEKTEQEKSEYPIEFKLKHTYNKEGNYNINLSVKSILEEGVLVSNPLVIPVRVQLKPPLIEFSRQGVQVNTTQQEFFIKAKQGSYSIRKWELDFGNGQKRTGEGEVEKSFVANYLPSTERESGSYRAVFSVTTADDKTYTKELSFRVSGGSFVEGVPSVIDTSLTPTTPVSKPTSKPTTIAEALKQEESPSQKTEKIDLAVERINLASEIFLREKTAVNVVVKNNSSNVVENVGVRLETEDGLNETKEITMKPQSTETLEFLWSPQKLGRQKITALLDYQDSNLRNNKLMQNVEIKQKETKPMEEKKEEEKEPIDLSLEGIEIKTEISVNKEIEVNIYLRNSSKEPIKNCSVIFEAEDGFRDKKEVFLKPKGQEKIKFIWTPKQVGKQKITALLEHKDDSNPRNNQLIQRVEVKSEEKREEEKKEEVSINISRLILEGEEQDTLPVGSPLVVMLEINSSTEFKEPIEINFFLKGKEFQQDFREKISSLERGKNKIRFELLKEINPDKYSLSVELVNPEYKIRLRERKIFVVQEEGER